jgi:hypothetical protein
MLPLELPFPCLLKLMTFLNTNEIINLLIATYGNQINRIKSAPISNIILDQKYLNHKPDILFII